MKATQEEQDRIQNIAQAIGQRFGYDSAHAEFSPLADLKMKWQRSSRYINLEISDYLVGAPDDVLCSLVEGVFKRIRGEYNGSTPYPQNVCEYLTDKKFAPAHRRTFLSRHRIEAKKYTSYLGIPVHLRKIPLGAPMVSGSSTLMKVITLDPAFVEEAESNEVIEVIKAEYNTIQRGLEIFGKTPKFVDCDQGVMEKYHL